MTTTGHIDGEIRRALQEIGDAAGVPPIFEDLGTVDVGPRRRAPRWGLVAALATAAAVVGVVLVARPDGASSPTRPHSTDAGGAPASVDATVTTSEPVDCGESACSDGADRELAPAPTDQEQALLDLVQPVLSDGFRAVYASMRPSPRVVVYGPDYARVDLSISLDAGRQMRRDMGPDQLHPVPGGSATADGLTIVTALDDVVSALPSSAPNDSESPSEAVEQAAVALVADVASSLDAAARERVRGGGQPVAGIVELGDRVGDLMEEHTGWTDTGGGGGSAGELVRWVTPRESGVGSGTIALSAFRTALRLPDETVRTDAQRVTATRWVAGWQLVVTAFATSADPAPASEAELQSLLDVVSGAFTEWRPAVVSAPVCGTYTFRPTDNVATIAERFGVTVDEFIEVNPDITLSAIPGDQISVPCGAVEQTRSADHTGLTGYVGELAADFVEHNRVTVASDRRVWIVAGGSDTRQGQPAIALWTFDRGTGETLATLTAGLRPEQCGGPVEIVDDLEAPLDAIPIRCTADGAMATVDVFSGQASDFGR